MDTEPLTDEELAAIERANHFLPIPLVGLDRLIAALRASRAEVERLRAEVEPVAREPEPVAEPEPEAPRVVDLMEALEASLEAVRRPAAGG